LLGAGWIVALVAPSPRVAHAAEEPPHERCIVKVVPPSAASTWHLAAAKVAEASAGTECMQLELHLTLDGALVVFTTAEGRQAVREVHAPDELAPTVDALRASVELAAVDPADRPASSAAASASSRAGAAESSSGPVEARPSASTVARAAELVETPAERPARAEAGDRGHWLYVGAGSALRIGYGGQLATPVLDVSVRAPLPSGWELGIGLFWEPYYWLEQAPKGFEMRGMSAELELAKKLDLGARWGLFAAGTVAVGLVEEELEAPDDSAYIDVTRTELRLGGRIGVLYPRNGVVRMRPSAGFDVAPTSVSQRGSLPTALPTPPEWSFTFNFAFELGL
jgi:hypothetical protein